VATASFAPVRSSRPDAPPGIEAVILKCLEKDKTRRCGNVAELALALADFGTKRSRPSIERIVDIIQASGLSSSARALPPSSVVARTPTPPTKKVSKSNETLRKPESGDYSTTALSPNTAPGVPRRPKALAIVGRPGGSQRDLRIRESNTKGSGSPLMSLLMPQGTLPGFGWLGSRV